MESSHNDDEKESRRSRKPMDTRRGRGDHWRLRNPEHSERDRSRSPMVDPERKVLASIRLEDIRSEDGGGGHEARMTRFECVGSYNWLVTADEPPTILVPGAPPVWRPMAANEELQPDSGQIVIDQSAFMWPTRPMEPLFRALEHPLRHRGQISAHRLLGSTLADVDVVIDRYTLAQLLEFIIKGAGKDFEFDVEVIGDTAVFVRREEGIYRQVEGFKGYGDTFPRENTRWEGSVEGSSSHHRILKFRFAGLGYLIRVDCDGYMQPEENSKRPSSQEDDEESQAEAGSQSGHSHSNFDTGKKGGEEAENAPASKDDEGSSEVNTSQLIVRSGGHSVSHFSCVDIKTRAAHRKLDLSTVLPRLWMSQTPILIVGYHAHGRFNNVRVKQVGKQLDEWEVHNQESLERLDVLVRKIVTEVKSSPHGKCRVRFLEGEVLEISELGAEYLSALPEDLYAEVASA